jgi:hypothetical protein
VSEPITTFDCFVSRVATQAAANQRHQVEVPPWRHAAWKLLVTRLQAGGQSHLDHQRPHGQYILHYFHTHDYKKWNNSGAKKLHLLFFFLNVLSLQNLDKFLVIRRDGKNSRFYLRKSQFIVFCFVSSI